MRFKLPPSLRGEAGNALSAAALALGLALAFPGSALAADGEPIPGVDVNLGKNPGGISVTLPRDAFGRFTLQLTEPGDYTVSTTCREPCPSHTITATYQGSGNFGSGANAGPAPIIAILIGLLQPAEQRSAGAPASASFSVDQRGARVSGQLPSAAGTYYVGTAGGGAWKTLAEINGQSSIFDRWGNSVRQTAAPKKGPNGELIWDTAGGSDGNNTPLPLGTISSSGAVLATESARRHQETENIFSKLELGNAESRLPQGGVQKPAGISVAVGDWDGDGRAETLVAPSSTGGDVKSSATSPDPYLKSPAVAPQSADAKPASSPSVFGQPVTFTATVTPSSPGTGTPTGSVTFRNSEGLRISENESPRPTERTITVTPINDAPSISDQGTVGGLISYATAPPPKQQDGNLPGIAGTPIQGTEVGLEGDPGSVKVSARTDAQGGFEFTKLPAGKYKILVPGQAARPVLIGTSGMLSGNLTRGSGDGFDITFGGGLNGANAAGGFRTGLPADKINTSRNPASAFGNGNAPGFGAGSGSGPTGGMIPGGSMIPGGTFGGAGSPAGALGGAGAGGAGGAMRR